jgi:aquaporin Z
MGPFLLVLAVLFLQAVIDASASSGATYPAKSTTQLAAFLMEVALTLGLVSLILGTASGAQNVGALGALGVGA